MSLPQLPTELIYNICQLAATSDLVALASANSSINSIAQCILFRHLSLTSNAHNLNLVATLARKPDLAQHVRTFSLRLQQSSAVFTSFYHILSNALCHMTGLHSLELFVDASVSWILSTSPEYPQLLHFASSFHLDHHVASFLGKTKALLELELDGSLSDSHPIPSTSIPRLSQFVGPSHVASAIVPGRPVETVHLSLGDLAKEDVVSLAKSTANIVILGATTSSPPIPLLQSLSNQMPHLAYLRLMTTCNFYEAPKPSFYEQIADILTSLPNLNGFELGGVRWGPPEKAAQEKGRVWPSQSLVGGVSSEQEADSDYELFFAH